LYVILASLNHHVAVLFLIIVCLWGTASKLRKAGIFSRVDDSNTSIGKRYARNDELGTPFGVTLDFACEYGPDDESAKRELIVVTD
jgi:hypothetical protein